MPPPQTRRQWQRQCLTGDSHTRNPCAHRLFAANRLRSVCACLRVLYARSQWRCRNRACLLRTSGAVLAHRCTRYADVGCPSLPCYIPLLRCCPMHQCQQGVCGGRNLACLRYRPFFLNAGVIVGLTAYANKCHIVRAALEAAAFQTYELVKVRHGVVWHPC